MRFPAAAALFLLLGLAVASPAAAVEAPCQRAMIGHGSPSWRSESLTAGPVGVRRGPLRMMERTEKGFVTKMPLLVEGREPETVTVSVPSALRQRVFLYYGAPSTFNQDPGFPVVEFHPCANKPRTIWPGGIRIKGEGPVHLDVLVEGRERPYVLRLGRPKEFDPPS